MKGQIEYLRDKGLDVHVVSSKDQSKIRILLILHMQLTWKEKYL